MVLGALDLVAASAVPAAEEVAVAAAATVEVVAVAPLPPLRLPEPSWHLAHYPALHFLLLPMDIYSRASPPQ